MGVKALEAVLCKELLLNQSLFPPEFLSSSTGVYLTKMLRERLQKKRPLTDPSCQSLSLKIDIGFLLTEGFDGIGREEGLNGDGEYIENLYDELGDFVGTVPTNIDINTKALTGEKVSVPSVAAFIGKLKSLKHLYVLCVTGLDTAGVVN